MADIRNKKRKTKGQLTSMTGVLESLFSKGTKSQLGHGFNRFKLGQQWEEVVGANMVKYCAPISYNKGTLYVWVSDSVRLQEMIFLLPQLKIKVNNHIGWKWARSIRLTLDRRSVPKTEEASPEVRRFFSKNRDYWQG